jgi:hypothetical protein
VNDLLAALDASALAQHLRGSRWTYPLVNSGHLFGIALLIGSIVALDLRALGLIRGPEMPAVTTLLRPIALAGFLLALACGLLLFVAQTGEYLPNRWFQIKMALLALALANALWHLRARPLPGYAALASLLLWPAILICGRMIGYS